MIDNLKREFFEVFKEESKNVYFAPGRVNLIGEHTDYNGGNVFPAALTIGTYGLISERDDKLFKVYSKNFNEKGIIQFSLDNLKYEKQDDWANYPKGIISEFIKNGHKIEKGLNVYFFGNIPNGAGLSSSASIEVLMGIILKDIYKINIDMISIAKLSQKVENEYIGVNSGIMDQFAVSMGKKDHAILLDTNTLEYRYAPIKLENMSLVISNTNKQRGLQDSKYNKRRSECEEALAILQTKLDIETLGDLSEKEFDENKYLIKDDILVKRAKHAVYENVRTLKAVKALEENNLKEFGKLMYDSHKSLRDDYDVTGVELDTLVDLAKKQKGVIGSRMTGAGFGGCTVSIIKDENIDGFIDSVSKSYKEIIGYDPEFYTVNIGDGAKKIS
ncbi:MAG: galactokinase [Clostridium sp.]|nr:galactokinase [Clostridium sp.]